ncbi:hypothetical protein [Amycolatopsis sp. cmx-4-54]|uniref:hypothetical protein n=1 Tax=Amycolatopsis sp. cmx-4-54 TaxID=2790936 RepID=UPI003979AD12
MTGNDAKCSESMPANFPIPLALIAGSPVVVSVPIALSNIGSWATTTPILIVVLLLLIVYTVQTFAL